MDRLNDAFPVNGPADLEFSEWLAAAFQWSPQEADHNVSVMFPSHQRQQHAVQVLQAAVPGSAAYYSRPSPFAASGISAPHIQGVNNLALSSSSPFQGISSIHAFSQQHDPVLWPSAAGIMIPSNEEAAALASEILLMQQQLQHQRPSINALQQPPLPQPEQQQKQNGNGGDGTDEGNQQQQQQQQAGRRGRPQKQNGHYSKRYLAIKRRRAKEKGMVVGLEAQVAEKLQQLQLLQAEHHNLSSRLWALQAAAGNQEEMFAQLAHLNLSVGPVDQTAAAAAAAGGLGHGSDSSSQHSNGVGVQGSTHVNARAYQRQAQMIQEREAEKRHLAEAPALWARYKSYIDQAAAQLAGVPLAPSSQNKQQQQQQRFGQGSEAVTAVSSSTPGRPVPGSMEDDGTGYQPFPFNIMEALALWKLSRHAGVEVSHAPSPPAAGAAAGNGSGDGSSSNSAPGLHMYTINLQTRKHDPVDSSFWAKPAAQVTLRQEQRRQLEACWVLYKRAIDKLNAERQQLLQQLQRAVACASHPSSVPSSSAANNSSSDVVGTGMSALVRSGSGASSSGSSSDGDVSSVGGCLAVQRLISASAGALDLEGYEALIDAVELDLMRGRAIIMMFGWSMLTVMVDNEQVARICVSSWPYFPLVRAIVGHMLGTEELLAP